MSDSLLETTIAVMDALGGTQAVADLTKSKYSAAFNWRSAEAFPAKTYVIMSSALKAIGKRAPASLWGMIETVASPTAAPATAEAAS